MTSRKTLWAGRAMSGFAVLFLLVDATVKVLELPPALEATTQLGYPASNNFILGLGNDRCSPTASLFFAPFHPTGITDNTVADDCDGRRVHHPRRRALPVGQQRPHALRGRVDAREYAEVRHLLGARRLGWTGWIGLFGDALRRARQSRPSRQEPPRGKT